MNDGEGVIIDFTMRRHSIISLDVRVGQQDRDLFPILFSGSETLREMENQSEATFK